MKSEKSFIEVCAGCGGLSTGLVLAGFTPLLLNDINKDACDTLRQNHGDDVRIECCPMETLDLTTYAGRVDLLAGGIPCQSFSYAGKQKGMEDDRGRLFLHFVGLLRGCRPRMFMIENVKGLKSNQKGETMKKIIESLECEGEYSVQYQLLDAKYFNVPQHRERIFIVGIRRDLPSAFFRFPVQDPTIAQIIPLRIALKDVPLSEGFLYNEKKTQLFEKIPPGGCWVDLPETMQHEYLGKKMMESGGGKRGILRRLHMDHPSLTLLCTPSQKQTERCHPLEVRPLRIREYARIQTFPDTYTFCGSLSSQYRQIGNAVPVELARHIGRAIIDFFQKITQNPKQN